MLADGPSIRAGLAHELRPSQHRNMDWTQCKQNQLSKQRAANEPESGKGTQFMSRRNQSHKSRVKDLRVKNEFLGGYVDCILKYARAAL